MRNLYCLKCGICASERLKEVYYRVKSNKMTEAGRLEADTPYILYSESGYSGTVSGTVDASGYPESFSP